VKVEPQPILLSKCTPLHRTQQLDYLPTMQSQSRAHAEAQAQVQAAQIQVRVSDGSSDVNSSTAKAS